MPHVAIISAGAAGLASVRHVAAEGIDCEVLEMLPELGGTWIYTEDVEKDQYGFPIYSEMYKDLRWIVIGAGAAGLASARHVAAEGIDCEVLEMMPELGGIWTFTEDIGKDRYGFPIYSAMYKDLRTNLPKEIMGFPDFPIENPQEISFVFQAELLEFLNQYADHFELRKLIKFNRMVTEIRPTDEEKWQIKSIDKPTKKEFTDIYDCVMVCNGHFNEPIVPKLPGQELFKGAIQHSQQYRSPDPFRKQKVLVIGSGPSGLDVALHVAAVAQNVVLSHHSDFAEYTKFPENVSKKTDVLRIKGAREVEFVDGSCDDFDSIWLCTGYRYSYPFLHDSCGVTVEDNFFVQPLYKQMIHIERPTMCFIGLPNYVCAFQLFDIQARFYCKYLNGSLTLPSSELMRMDTEDFIQDRVAKGYTKKKYHYLNEDQQMYFDDLAKMANITSIQPVMPKIYDEVVKNLFADFQNFRETRYKIIDDQNFVKTHLWKDH